MEKIELEVFTEQSNHAVVRMNGREFPGIVIQGDSLSILCEEAKEISQRLKEINCTDEDLLYLAQEHQDNLLSRSLHYQNVLSTHGLSLPYQTAALPSDLITLVAEDDDNAL